MPDEVRIFQSARQPLHWAIAVSLALHAAVLFYPRLNPEIADRPARRIEARLVPPPAEPLAAVPAPAMPPPAAQTPPARQKLPALEKPPTPPAPAAPQAWSKADKADMNQFLRELEPPPRASADLAQRALAMARAVGRQEARQDEESEVLVERRPDGPPPDPVSLEMYMDSLVRKLNRSAAFVKNDPRRLGV